ncbi:sensor histidine kinase [Lachnospiraceae bacterium]|jgi:signal transduction histidine kinase|nr:sensor histidine kinase [Lachnospiraceae bacterium]
MGLSKKTFLYSIILAVIMTVFILGYFVLMLPSLYVDYVMDSNLKLVMEIQEGYMEDRTYDGLAVKNPSSVYTMEIPDEGTEIYVSGKFFKMTVKIQDEELLVMLDSVRKMMDDMGDNGITGGTAKEKGESTTGGENGSADGENTGRKPDYLLKLWEQIKGKFTEENLFAENCPVAVQVEGKEKQGIYREEYSKIHRTEGNSFVYEGGVSDGDYSYTTYVAMGRVKDAFIITVLPTMTPRMEEIRPVVMGSLPMIGAVMFLLVLLASRFFSGKIVNPIIRLAGYAESVRALDGYESEAFISDSEDEIGALGRALHELYRELSEKYQELELKNKALEEENERQEVFLRATSHQLKTPVTAALLVVEGMMNEVGKYKNTKEYLPEVKKHLLSMRKIVEDILYLNYHAENMQKEELALEALVQELIRTYKVQADDKGLDVSVRGSGMVKADREMMKKIVDNILSNAVQYTPEGQRIEIEAGTGELYVKNYGVSIDPQILPNIFEPFVSSDESRKGKGLGLYVASYYSRLSGCELKVENIENGVQARLKFL